MIHCMKYPDVPLITWDDEIVGQAQLGVVRKTWITWPGCSGLPGSGRDCIIAGTQLDGR